VIEIHPIDPDTTPFPPQTVDGRLEALSNHTRRFLFYYLREHGDATWAELTDVVTGWLATSAGIDAGSAACDERRIALQHVHLPKLLECASPSTIRTPASSRSGTTPSGWTAVST
jgi:hypothetical protein